MRRRVYRPRFPSALSEADFGASFSTPDPFTLTTQLYIKFHMRHESWGNSGPFASTHQWGQWGAEGNHGWGYSIHGPGSPEPGHVHVAVYPLGTDASLIGAFSPNPFPYAANEDAWVAAFVELDIGGGNRRFRYWHSKRGIGNPITFPQYWDDMGGAVTEAGATSFFNSTAAVTSLGNLNSAVQEFYEMEIRETPTGPLLLRPDLGLLKGEYIGSFIGGSGPWNTYTDRLGTVWTVGPFNRMQRSKSPRCFAA